MSIRSLLPQTIHHQKYYINSLLYYHREMKRMAVCVAVCVCVCVCVCVGVYAIVCLFEYLSFYLFSPGEDSTTLIMDIINSIVNRATTTAAAALCKERG